MRVMYRRADLLKELQAFGCRQALLIGILSDGLAFDVFHHEVRPPVAGGAAVEQAGDVRVIQRREDLPFIAKAAQDEFRIHAALDELDGDLLLELCVITLCEVDRAHAALADPSQDAIRADGGVIEKLLLFVC